jgi:hypothetical protein
VAAVLVAALFSALVVTPAAAKCPGKVLGRDVRGDAPPQMDLLGLMALRCGPDLGIMFQVQRVEPASPIYALAHARWGFVVDDRTFVVEAEAGVGSAFVLSEWISGELREVDTVRGSYDMYNHTIGVLVPMKLVGAKVGSRLAGARELDAEDASFRVGAGTTGQSVDSLTTTKHWVIPRWW